MAVRRKKLGGVLSQAGTLGAGLLPKGLGKTIKKAKRASVKSGKPSGRGAARPRRKKKPSGGLGPGRKS